MRERLRRVLEFFADRLTVAERWILCAILLVAVFGCAMKYCRERPQLVSPDTLPAGDPTPPDD